MCEMDPIFYRYQDLRKEDACKLNELKKLCPMILVICLNHIPGESPSLGSAFLEVKR